MSKKTTYILFPRLRIVLAIIFILPAAISCLKEGEKTKYSNLIPEKDFIAILNDLYMTNGLLSLPDFRTHYMTEDTTGLYVEIIEEYGYRTSQMDTTIQYYYKRKPKKLIKIYDQMLGKFSEIEARLDQTDPGIPLHVNDKWEGRPAYFLPDPEGKEKADFSIKLAGPGTYTLRFRATISPDDQTFCPCYTVWMCNADSSETGKKYYLPSINYIKDGHPHRYTIIGTNISKSKICLKGFLYDFASNPVAGKPDAVIEDITFYYSGTLQ
jgi:hypothetical protein